MPLADQRVLTMSNPNYYFIRKQDFNSPNIYNLNIIKPFGRSKIRTFVSNDLCTNEKQREGYMNSIRNKFLSKSPMTSQITTERTTANVPYRNTIEDQNKVLKDDKMKLRFQTQFQPTESDSYW